MQSCVLRADRQLCGHKAALSCVVYPATSRVAQSGHYCERTERRRQPETRTDNNGLACIADVSMDKLICLPLVLNIVNERDSYVLGLVIYFMCAITVVLCNTKKEF